MHARLRRPASILLVAGASVALLAGCTKPLPKITAQAGSTALTVNPSRYCFEADSCRDGEVDIPRISVSPDARVLVAVPRNIADRGWQVQALSLEDITKVLGASGPIDSSHSYRVAGSVAGGSAFIVRVEALRGGEPDGSTWSFVVTPSATG